MLSGSQSQTASTNGAPPGDSLLTDPMQQHLNACQDITVERARRSFNHYLEDLEIAFDHDIKSALSRREPFDSAVEQILVEIQSDVKSATDTLLELSSFSQNVSQRQEAAAKRAATFVRGENHLRSVKIRVYEEVLRRTQRTQLPSTLLLFLFQPWTDFLCFTALRYGERSSRWDQAVALMDKLIVLVKPEQAAALDASPTLHTGLPGNRALACETLLRDIRDGLATIRYDKEKSHSLVQAIAELLKDGAAKAEAAGAEAQTITSTARQQALSEARPKVKLSQRERDLIERLNGLEFGTLFEFRDGRRLKLAWYNARTSRYMMVDAQRQNSQIMTALELARLIIARRARILPRPTRAKAQPQGHSRQPA